MYSSLGTVAYAVIFYIMYNRAKCYIYVILWSYSLWSKMLLVQTATVLTNLTTYKISG